MAYGINFFYHILDISDGQTQPSPVRPDPTMTLFYELFIKTLFQTELSWSVFRGYRLYDQKETLFSPYVISKKSIVSEISRFLKTRI